MVGSPKALPPVSSQMSYDLSSGWRVWGTPETEGFPRDWELGRTPTTGKRETDFRARSPEERTLLLNSTWQTSRERVFHAGPGAWL